MRPCAGTLGLRGPPHGEPHWERLSALARRARGQRPTASDPGDSDRPCPVRRRPQTSTRWPRRSACSGWSRCGNTWKVSKRCTSRRGGDGGRPRGRSRARVHDQLRVVGNVLARLQQRARPQSHQGMLAHGRPGLPPIRRKACSFRRRPAAGGLLVLQVAAGVPRPRPNWNRGTCWSAMAKRNCTARRNWRPRSKLRPRPIRCGSPSGGRARRNSCA